MKKTLITSTTLLLLTACGGGSSNTQDNNIPPVANAGTDREAIVNEYITLTGTGSDTDGEIVAYEWKKGDTVLATTASFEYLPTIEVSTITSPVSQGDIGTDILTFSVTDNDGATATDTLSIQVKEITNQPPTANAGEDKYIGYHQSVTLVGTGEDSDGSVVSYQWKFWDSVVSEESTYTYSPSEIIRSPSFSEGVDEFTLVVTDNNGATATDTVLVEFYDDTVETQAESTSSTEYDDIPICGEAGVIVSPCRSE